MELNHTIFSNARFIQLVIEIDKDFVHQAKVKNCPFCKSKLNYARYLRKPRFMGDDLPKEWEIFDGLCCSREGCRKRVRPRSVRYAGRSPYSNALFLLIKLLKTGSNKSVLKISRELQISEKTVRRWILLWRKIYAGSKWWRKIVANFMLGNGDLHKLLEILEKNSKDAFYRLNVEISKIWEESELFYGKSIYAKDA